MKIRDIELSNNSPLTVIAGPCSLENEDMIYNNYKRLKEICSKYNVKFIYKISFDKANRSSINSFRGLGIENGINVIRRLREKFPDIYILTDIHERYQIDLVKNFVDIIQVPAFLCRQTDLLVDCGNSRKVVSIKKGQFMAPKNMKGSVDKVKSTGNERVFVIERGFTFGYNNLVVDMRSFDIMKKFSDVVFDATHSVQLPGGNIGSSGGEREYVITLAKAAVATKIAGLYLEVHECPDEALCDGPNMLDYDMFDSLLDITLKIDKIVKKY